MSRKFIERRNIFILLLLVLFIQGCMRTRLNAPAVIPDSQATQPVSTEEPIEPSVTPRIQIDTPVPTATAIIIPTETLLPKVTISATKGNVFIRRGPGLAYNQIGVLYKGTSADVIARDVLLRWVQIAIPDSDRTGWVSLKTEFTELNGELSTAPEFTVTDWPLPAYLYNCTEHDMYIMPGEIVLTSYFTHPDNQVWLYPGTYTVYDDMMPGRPEVKTVEIREGVNDAIVVDGSGNSHKCP